MLIGSMVAISIGVYYYTEEEKFLDQCKLIKCKVAKIDEAIPGKPVLTLKDISGTYPAFQYNESYDASDEELDYKLNEVYEVYYYPKDVNKSQIKGFVNNHETSFILFIIGIVCLIDFPTMLFVASLQRKKNMAAQTSTYGIKDNVISE